MKAPVVLIVEADSNVRHALVDALRSAGHRTLEAAGEETARAVLGCVIPHLVLVEHGPAQAGVRLISWLREARSSSAAPLPVVGMAGSEPEAEALLAAGATRVLRKPFGPEALTGAVARVLSRCGARADPGEGS
jgi:DNA-binding response OmpR family regulator